MNIVKEADEYISAVKRYFKTTDTQYRTVEANLKTAVQKHMRGKIDKSEAYDAFSTYEKYVRTKDFFKKAEKDMQYKTGRRILSDLLSSDVTGASPGRKKGSAGSKVGPGGVTGVRKPVQNKATQNAPTDAKKKVPEVANTHGKKPTGDKETVKDDLYETGEEFKKKLKSKEGEMNEITEELQSLAKEFSIQGDSPVEIIHHMSRELKTAKEQSNQEQTKRNVKELEYSLEDLKKAVFGVQRVQDKDHAIAKTMETIQDLQRQKQELLDLKTAVINPNKTKGFKLTQSTEEALARVQTLHSNVKELESSLEDLKKAVFGVSKLKDKDHDNEKAKEKIEGLQRQEQELLDLKTAVFNPKKTKDFKLTQSAKETLERVQALHSTEEVCFEWKKLVFDEQLQKLASTDYLEQSQQTVENAKALKQTLIRTIDEHNGKIPIMEKQISDLKSQLADTESKKQKIQESKEEIERKLSDDLKKLQSEKERLLTRTVDDHNGKIHKMEKQISELKNQLDDTELKKQKIQKSKEEMERKLNDDLKKLQREKERLLTRLSEVAGTRLTAGNPNITDLSDSNRPTKIAEQFSELYDNLWTDVFEQLTKNSNMSDKEAIANLLKYLEKSYASCKDIFTQRYRNIVREFMVWKLVAPAENSSQKKGIDTPRETTTITTEEIQKLQGLLNSNSPMDVKTINPLLAKFGLDVTNLSYIKNLLKTTAEETSVFVEEAIWKQMIENPTGGKPINEFVKPYVKKCVRLCWLMVAHDPPVCIKPSAQQGSKFDKEYYREFLATGKVLDYVVWPALLLHENGPLLHKGVAQPVAKK